MYSTLATMSLAAAGARRTLLLLGWLVVCLFACLLACSAGCGVWLPVLSLAGGLLAADSEVARVWVG